MFRIEIGISSAEVWKVERDLSLADEPAGVYIEPLTSYKECKLSTIP